MSRVFVLCCLLLGADLFAAESRYGVSLGLKAGLSFSDMKYQDKITEDAFFVDIFAGKGVFSKAELASGKIIEIFANKDFYNNGSIFVNTELGFTLGGPKYEFDQNLFNRIKVTDSDGWYGNVMINERFSSNFVNNIGVSVTKNLKVYGKIGLDLASVKIKQTYEADIGDTAPPYVASKNIIMPGLILGVGCARNVSDATSAILELTYTIRNSKKLKDIKTNYEENGSYDINFIDRKFSLNKAALKIGVCFAI